MVLDTLRHRHAFFAAVAPEILQPTAARVSAATRPYEAAIAPGILASVTADLIYAVARHHRWREAPLFTDVLADLLTREYRLTGDVATAIALAATGCREFDGGHGARDGHVPATDREFLRYVFVASATAASEASLIVDLGLGTALVTRIRSTVASTVAARQPDAPLRFLPEIDAHISEILCELAKEAKHTPWTLSVHRLRYLLLDAPAPLGPWLKVHGARALFDLLLAVGSRDNASLRQIATRLKRLANGAETGIEDAVALTQALSACELVFACEASIDDDRQRYQLTPLAQELTAEAFARNHVFTNKTPLVALSSLCAPYQAAVIRALESPTVPILTELVETARPLSPLGLRAAMERLHDVAGATAATPIVAGVAAHDSSPWLRRVAEQFMRGQKPTGDGKIA